VREHEDKPVGVVRVYESYDTPHVVRGAVYVRGVAQDRRYEARGVDTQAALIAIAARGATGVQRARERFEADRVPLAQGGLGIGSGWGILGIERTRVALRAAPISAGRLDDWAVSRRGMESATGVVRQLTRRDDDAEPSLTPAASGLVAQMSTRDFVPIFDGADQTHSWNATAVLDRSGVVGTSVLFGEWDPPRPTIRLTLNGLRDHIVRPLIDAVAQMLEEGELYGRSLLELRIGDLAPVVQLDDEGGLKPLPGNLPIGGEINLPLEGTAELDALADLWRAEIGRAAGYFTLRP
jgi:hypothetical protein